MKRKNFCSTFELDMALSARVWGAGKILLLVVALLTTYALSAVLSARLALRAREVRVPSVVGASVNAASSALADVGLSLKVEEGRRIEPKIPPGRIARQDPAPGVPARRGRGVRVWLSSGSRATAIPALVGETVRTAQLRIEQDGLAISGIAEIRSNQFPADTVISQDPAAGASGRSVHLLVNRGDRAATYVMPDLIGLDGARATDVLRSNGFRVAVVAQQPYPGVPSGVVLRQSPQAGFQVAPGDTVSLEVSR
ncbi:MAG: PASTA domain-containing protein [Acidobacteria bacterium]|nr:MAG: PASTA domain-containing protein [Acidobacteriota bacterium]